MDIFLRIKSEKKTKEKPKFSFLYYFIAVVIFYTIIVFTLVYSKYNFYIGVENEKEKIEVTGYYSNLINDI